MRTSNSRQHRQGGYVLVLVTLIVAAITTAAVTISFVTENEARSSAQTLRATQAMSTAQAGLRMALAAAREENSQLAGALFRLVNGDTNTENIGNVSFHKWPTPKAMYYETWTPDIDAAMNTICTVPETIGSGQVCIYLMDDPSDTDSRSSDVQTAGRDSNFRLLIRVYARVGRAEAMVGQVINRDLPPPGAITAGGNCTTGNGFHICGSGGIGCASVSLGGGTTCMCGALQGNTTSCGGSPCAFPADQCAACATCDDAEDMTGEVPDVVWPSWWGNVGFGTSDLNVGFRQFPVGDSLPPIGSTVVDFGASNGWKAGGATKSILLLKIDGTVHYYDSGLLGCGAFVFWYWPHVWDDPPAHCWVLLGSAGVPPVPLWLTHAGTVWTINPTNAVQAAEAPAFILAQGDVTNVNVNTNGNWVHTTILAKQNVTITGDTRIRGFKCNNPTGTPGACNEAGANAVVAAGGRGCFAIRAGQTLTWNANLYTVGAVLARIVDAAAGGGCVMGSLAAYAGPGIGVPCDSGGMPGYCGSAALCFKNNADVVVGDLITNGDLCAKNNPAAFGDVYVGGSMSVKNNATINGQVVAGGDVDFKNGGDIIVDVPRPRNMRTGNVSFEMLR